jgi:hypothetical protein
MADPVRRDRYLTQAAVDITELLKGEQLRLIDEWQDAWRTARWPHRRDGRKRMQGFLACKHAGQLSQTTASGRRHELKCR